MVNWRHQLLVVDTQAEEQRRRADLLVRATKAGLLEWDAASGAVTYSDRFKEMLGYAADADTAASGRRAGGRA